MVRTISCRSSSSERPASSNTLLLRLAVQDGYRVAVELLGALAAVADTDGAELAVLGERSDQVEDDSLLGGGVEVEAVVHRDVYQVVGSQAFVRRALEVVRGVVVAGLVGGRAVGPVPGVVGAVGQELQHQVRMGRPAFADVDLYGGVFPAALALDRDEVDSEAFQHPSFLEHFRYPASGVLDLLAVLGVCGEGAAQEDLTRRPAQHLIVGRDDRGPAQRVYAALHRRGAYFLTLHEAFDDAAHLRELLTVVLPGLAECLEADPA